MARLNQAGFSLIELMLVLAITGSLASIAFVGQSALRSQAQFDATVDKLSSSIAGAHNQAAAGVNIVGSGDGSACGGAPAPAGEHYVFAGVAWTTTDTANGAVIKMDYYAALASAKTYMRTGAAPCLFHSEGIGGSEAVRTNPAPPSRGILFVRDNAGGIDVCWSPSLGPEVAASFSQGACVAPATSNATNLLNLSDFNNHTSTVQIDPSGQAHRLN